MTAYFPASSLQEPRGWIINVKPAPSQSSDCANFINSVNSDGKVGFMGRYLALIELGPVSDFNAVEKHMEVNVFHVALELAFSE